MRGATAEDDTLRERRPGEPTQVFQLRYKSWWWARRRRAIEVSVAREARRAKRRRVAAANHEPRVPINEARRLLLEPSWLVDRDRTRATGVVAPPAPPMLLLSHGEEFEERARMASEVVARIGSYVELLCLVAVDRAVVEYFDVSVGWVQQQQQLEQQQPEQQQQLELQLLVQRQREQRIVHRNWEKSLRVSDNIMQDTQRSLRCRVCARWGRVCRRVCCG